MDLPTTIQPSRPRNGSSVASFLLKTFEILEVVYNLCQNPNYTDIISWASDNVSFIIKNCQQFSKQILPRYFRHNNFSSFVRQLNMYDFHKIKQDKHSIVFRNELFTRNGLKQLKQIRRKAPRNTRIDTYDLSEAPRSIATKSFQQQKNRKLLLHSRRILESEINNSSNLFEKTIRTFQRIVNSKESIRLFTNDIPIQDIENIEHSQDTHITNTQYTNTLQMIYQLKKKCHNIFCQYEQMVQSIDKGYQAKSIVLSGAQTNNEQARYTMIEKDNSACSSSKSQAISKQPKGNQNDRVQISTGFKPFSSHTLNSVGRVARVEQTKISSSPLLELHVS